MKDCDVCGSISDVSLEDAWSLFAHGVEFMLGYLPSAYEDGFLSAAEYSRLWTGGMAAKEAAYILSHHYGGPLHRMAELPHDRDWVEQLVCELDKQYILDCYRAGDLEQARKNLRMLQQHAAHIPAAAAVLVELTVLAPELQAEVPQIIEERKKETREELVSALDENRFDDAQRMIGRLRHLAEMKQKAEAALAISALEALKAARQPVTEPFEIGRPGK